MPKFDFEYQCRQEPQEAFSIIDQVLGNTDEITKLDSSAKWVGDAKNLCGRLNSKQFKAQVRVLPAQGGGSRVVVDAEIGLLLTPLKGTIRDILTKKFSKYLG